MSTKATVASFLTWLQWTSAPRSRFDLSSPEITTRNSHETTSESCHSREISQGGASRAVAKISSEFSHRVTRERLSKRDVWRPQNRQRLRAEYAAFNQRRHGPREALVWGLVPLHCAVSIWKLARKHIHGWIVRPAIDRPR